MKVGCLERWLAALVLTAAVVACPAADLHAFTEPLPPLNYEEGGEVRGFSTDLLRLMLQRAGLAGDFQVLPWPRAVQMAAADARSVLYTLTRTAARETQYRWVGPIAKRRILLFRLADRPEVQVRSLDDLRKIHTAVARESATAKQLAELGYTPYLDIASNDEASMRMLIAHRVDAVAMLDFAAAWQSQRQGPGFKSLQPLITLDDQHEYYYGLHKDAPDDLVQALQRALDGLRREGEVDRLAQRYFQ